ncbi:MAG: acyl-CoA dehydrogenase family protein [Alphaproteobacteria bacterium]
MHLSFSDEDEAFRAEVRQFIADNYTNEMKAKHAQSKNGYMDKDSIVAWQKALYAKGWVAHNWPVEFGGPGFTPTQKFIYEVEMGRGDTPTTSPMGLSMVAPVIMAFGNDEQKAQHLPPILSSDVWWCQGYSEPGSGSDLASLSMKAEDKGDHYLLNGTKTWTTQAQFADWMFCLVRTSKEGKKQEGISFVLLPMDTPGVEISVIRTLDGPAEGEQEINSVFFTDVKVPKENRIGEENKGWTYAKYLLEFERGNPYSPALYNKLNKVKKIARAEQSNGAPLMDDADFARQVAQLETEIRAMEFFEYRFFSALSTGGRPGAEGSILKTRGTELEQAISMLAVEAVGTYAMPFVEDTWALKGNDRAGPEYAAPVAPYYFNRRKATIYAGSNEIQRGILAKQVLGL